MKKIIFIFILSSLFSCFLHKEVSIKDEKTSEPKNISIGPFFLPENSFFTSISINYITSRPLSTRVYFTMAGEIDWVREDKKDDNLHKMLFRDLEENTTYKFYYQDEEKKREGLIKTIPYGEEYEFDFCIITTESICTNNTAVGFVAIISDKSKMNINDFSEFYSKNEKFLTSAIILPVFEIFYNDKNIFKTKEEGFDYFYYRDVAIIGINKKLENYDKILYYIPDNGKVYLIVGDIGKKEVEIISKKFSFFVEKIYVHKNSFVKANKIVSVDSPLIIKVTKNSRYAMVSKEVIGE